MEELSCPRRTDGLHHPSHDLAGYHVENMSGKSLIRWKMLNQAWLNV
jgi:hypothetical protein